MKKEEMEDGEDEGACGWSEDMAKEFRRVSREAKDSLREAAVKMAAEAGMNSSSVSRAVLFPAGRGSEVGTRDVNKHGGAHFPVAGPAMKTPKYSGRADWEAFHAQFELLAHAEGWSMEAKALQLALCLTDDALSCLLLISPEDSSEAVWTMFTAGATA